MSSTSVQKRELLKAFAYAVAAALTAMFVVAIATTVVLHWVDPAHWGLWTGDGIFLFGRIADSMHAQAANWHVFHLYGAVFLGIGCMSCREFAGFARAAWRKARQGAEPASEHRPLAS